MSSRPADHPEVFSALFTSTRESAVDHVVENIIQLIRTKQLFPGDRIPAELELSSLLNVSRGSVREAMRVLAAYGLIEVKRGDGTYISASQDNISWDPLFLKFMLIDPSEAEMLELRIALERVIMFIAIDHANAEDLEDVRMAHYDMKLAVEKGLADFEQLTELDIAFHLAVTRATHNRLLNSIYQCIMHFFKPYIQKSMSAMDNYGKQAVETHKAALMAMENRSYEEGQNAVKYIVDVWQRLAFSNKDSEQN